MKALVVVCALIEHEGYVLGVQRSAHMSHPLLWEFPGGKCLPNEPPEQALRREVREELCMEVAVGEELNAVSHRYGEKEVLLKPFVCSTHSTKLTLTEHAAVLWCTPAMLPSLQWLEADVAVVRSYLIRSA